MSKTFFPDPTPVPFYLLPLTVIRNIWTNITPLWSYRAGAWNAQADVEGPYYLIGAPSRELEGQPGKAVLAPKDLLEQFQAFLLTGRVTGADGQPLANTKLDIWHVDTQGSYHFRTYTLRGTLHTAPDGSFEILTVPFTRYGPSPALTRPAHIHIMLSPPPDDTSRSQAFTTQQYLCTGNDIEDLKRDMIAPIRGPRTANMLHAWSAPGKPFMDLPTLAASNTATTTMEVWNTLLANAGSSARIVAGAHTELALNGQKGWF